MKSQRLDRALNARPDKWLPPAAYKAWRRKLANQARGQRQTQEFIARAYDRKARQVARRKRTKRH
jgi:hypothetical protein